MDATLLYFSRSAAQPASAWISRLERAPECRVGWGLAASLENMLGDWGTASELRADHYTEGQYSSAIFESLTSVDGAAHSFVVVFNRKAFTETTLQGRDPREGA
jgi:hypothetical protein